MTLSEMPERQVAGERPRYHHGNLRQALLEAGLQITRSGGADALVLRDVTRRVGVSPNAAYRHFSDRMSLLQAVAEQIQRAMAERMLALEPPESAGDDATSARRRLRAVGLGYIAFALAEPGWFDTAFTHVGSVLRNEPDARPPLPLGMLLSALDALVATGELAPERRPGAEWPCWSAVHGFATMALHGPLLAVPSDEVWAAAERTVDDIITGVLAESG